MEIRHRADGGGGLLCKGQRPVQRGIGGAVASGRLLKAEPTTRNKGSFPREQLPQPLLRMTHDTNPRKYYAPCLSGEGSVCETALPMTALQSRKKE